MPEKNALYVYGIVKNGPNMRYKGTGLNEEKVYTIKEGDFSAFVHDCEEKPYISEDPGKIREMVITHNSILNRAMEDFGGVIPLPFNTIIKAGENSVHDNLKKWLKDDKDRLEKIWHKIKGRKEYAIRIYYEKDKLMQEVSAIAEIRESEKNLEGKSAGISYLLQEKTKSRTNEIVQERINQFKQEFYSSMKKITDNVKVNISRIFIKEEKELLLSLSILINEGQADEIKRILEKTGKDFPFQLAGPFAPYSFVENGTKH